MITLTQLATSTEPIQLQVVATANGLPYSPVADSVAIAFVPVTSPPSSEDPTSGEWNAATWETDPGPTFWASILVGPLNGGVALAVGSYICVVKVTDNQAVPVKPGAYLTIV